MKELKKDGVKKMKVYRCRVCGEVYIGEEKPKSCPFCGAHETYFVLAKEWKLLYIDLLSDISKDNLRKALDLEINNTNFYKAVSGKSKDIYISSMFKGLSKVEREHASALCKHLKIQRPDSNVGSDEAVDSDQENIKEANRRERSAVKFYGEAMKQAPEKEIKEFFNALMQIESDHIVLTD
ncbi:MAG: ferritin family protein [Candidatus Omnitrophota bacterium]|nr:ferritin family protein [Candidatus Omnitrophota bacterium]